MYRSSPFRSTLSSKKKPKRQNTAPAKRAETAQGVCFRVGERPGLRVYIYIYINVRNIHIVLRYQCTQHQRIQYKENLTREMFVLDWGLLIRIEVFLHDRFSVSPLRCGLVDGSVRLDCESQTRKKS